MSSDKDIGKLISERNNWDGRHLLQFCLSQNEAWLIHSNLLQSPDITFLLSISIRI